jgi:acyl-CoA thioester hydrolase
MGRILRNIRSITPMSRIGRNFLVSSMRIYGNFLPSVLLGRIYGKFRTTNSYALSIYNCLELVKMNSNTKEHQIKLDVRDYECDMADRVNNSVYYNYLEHARHSMLKSGGIDFAELARQSIGLVISKAEIDFVRSLMSGDSFAVKTKIFRASKLRFEFHQEIYRESDKQLIARAKITGTPINSLGRPKLTPELEALIVPMCQTLTE